MGKFWVTVRWLALLCAQVVLWLRCFPARSWRSKWLTFSRTEMLRVGPWLPSAKLLLPWLLAETTLFGLAHRWTSARAISRRVRGCSLSLSCSMCCMWWYCRATESLTWWGETWEVEVGGAWDWRWTGKWAVGTCSCVVTWDTTGSEWMLFWLIDLKGGQ